MPPPGGGGVLAPGRADQKFLYLKFKTGKDFPREAELPAPVVVKKGQFSGKSELNKDKEVVIAFPFPAPPEAIEISITDKNKAAVGKLKLEHNSEWYEDSETEAALSPYPFAADNDQKQQRLWLGVWSGSVTGTAVRDAVLAAPPAAANTAAVDPKKHPSLQPINHAHPKLAYYQLRLLPYIPKEPEKMNQKYMHFCLKATVANQTVQTMSLDQLPVDPAKATFLFWFVKVNGTPPDSVKLVLKLTAYTRPPVGETKTALKELGTAEKRLNALGTDKSEDVKVTTRGDDEEDKKETGVLVRVTRGGDLVGYHVFDEPPDRSSDLHATAVSERELAARRIGSMGVKIKSVKVAVAAAGKKGGKGTEVYCVARYDTKWSRTATFVNSPAPGSGDSFGWYVYEINTIFTVGLFENCQQISASASASTGDDKKKEPAEDKPIGRVRIHINSLSTNKTYNSEFVFLARQPDGSLKETGRLELEYRFTGTLMRSALQYFRPPLPPWHYTYPIPEEEVDRLRPLAAGLVAEELAKRNPPLMKKVVEYMYGVSDEDRRRRKQDEANREYMMRLGDRAYSALEFALSWRNPMQTRWVLSFFLYAIAYPELVLPTIFVILAIMPLKPYLNRHKPGYVPPVDVIMERAEPEQAANARYEVLRKKALEYETLLDKYATKAEGLRALLSWRNPLATATVMAFCAVAALLLCFVSFQTLATICVLCVFLHPLFVLPQEAGGIPLLNFLRRVPGLNDNDKTIT